MKKFTILLALVMITMMVVAGSAYAANSGTVYGDAQMAPHVAITCSGHGFDLTDRLHYYGQEGEEVGAANDGFTITNSGTQACSVSIGDGTNPSDGVDNWTLSDTLGATSAYWAFKFGSAVSYTKVPALLEAPRSVIPSLAIGAAEASVTQFGFPTTFDGDKFEMQATVWASAVE